MRINGGSEPALAGLGRSNGSPDQELVRRSGRCSQNHEPLDCQLDKPRHQRHKRSCFVGSGQR